MSLTKMVTPANFNVNNFSRYIEVALGASKGLLHFNPEVPCLLNDSNTDLIDFYKNLNTPELQKELHQFSANWKLIGEFSRFSGNEILDSFQDYTDGIISSEDIAYIIRAIVLMNMTHEEFVPLFEKKFIVSIDMFSNSLIKAVVDELHRLKGDLHIKEKQSDSHLFQSAIENAFRYGFYEHFKNLVNWQKTELIDCISLIKHLASWFFLKELKKGHHLQYDLNGNLKNHYGGIHCNENFFKDQINKVCEPAFLNKLKASKLYNLTPVDFLNEIKAGKNDIVLANLLDENIVLAQGKNHSGIKSHIAHIKQILTIDTNFMILCNDNQVAADFEKVADGMMAKTQIDQTFFLTNLK